MAASLITKAPSATTANTPPLVRDPMIRAGSKCTFDLTDARCHPGGVITPGVVAAGAIFTSLDPVPVQAVAQVGGVMTVNADGSITMAGGSLNESGLRIGGDRQFDMSAGEYERLMYLWAKLPVDGYTTTDFATMMAITPTNNNRTQATLDTGTGGLRPRFSIANTAGTSHVSASLLADVTRGVVHQFAGRFDPSARIEYFADGALRAGVDSTQADVYPPASGETLYLRVPNRVAMTVYRFGLLDIDASIAAETGYGYAAADILTSAQHVAADWQFGTGVLPGAPKIAFA